MQQQGPGLILDAGSNLAGSGQRATPFVIIGGKMRGGATFPRGEGRRGESCKMT